MPDKHHHHHPHHPTEEELLAKAIDISQMEDSSVEKAKPKAAVDELAPIELSEPASSSSIGERSSKIHSFGKQTRHEDHWSRTPNTTGTGAIHVKTFCAKLRLDAIEYLDQQVNEWLDSHPQYEVKFVTTTVGDLMGKMKEQALFMNVWV